MAVGKDQRPLFHVSCDAGTAGRFQVGTETLSVIVAQKIHGGTDGRMWDSVLVLCKKLEDGSATVEVTISHPNWAEPIRIASVQSFPQNSDGSRLALKCDLAHEHQPQRAD